MGGMTPDRIYILESFYKNIFYRKVWWEGRDDRQIYKKYILEKFGRRYTPNSL